MKKAKNVFAILGIVFAALAVCAIVGIPLVDAFAAKSGGGTIEPMSKLSEFMNSLVERFKTLFGFGWFSDLGANIHYLVGLVLAGIIVILFIVLLVFMIVKKHVKGLGWAIPMLILGVAAAAVVAGNGFNNNAGYVKATQEFPDMIILIPTYVAIAGCAWLILSFIFYFGYVCKASNKAKVEQRRADAIAKIDALLGGNN